MSFEEIRDAIITKYQNRARKKYLEQLPPKCATCGVMLADNNWNKRICFDCKREVNRKRALLYIEMLRAKTAAPTAP